MGNAEEPRESPELARSPDAAARVDLQEVLHRAYDGPGYEHFIYGGEPEPKLSTNDAAWARRLLKKVRAAKPAPERG